MSKKKAIFFDLDGVIVLTEPIHLAAWKEVLKDHSLPKDFFTLEEVFGKTDYSMAIELIDYFHLKEAPEALCEEKKVYYLKLLEKPLPSPEGRNAFLKKVTQHYFLAVISSATRKEVDEVLKKEKLSHYFHFALAFEDTKHHKPHPEPYQLAMEKANIPAEDILVIEDSPPGISAAKAAGLNVIALATTTADPFKDQQLKTYQNYNQILKDLPQLL